MPGPFDRFETQPDLTPRFLAVMDSAEAEPVSTTQKKERRK